MVKILFFVVGVGIHYLLLNPLSNRVQFERGIQKKKTHTLLKAAIKTHLIISSLRDIIIIIIIIIVVEREAYLFLEKKKKDGDEQQRGETNGTTRGRGRGGVGVRAGREHVGTVSRAPLESHLLG